MLSLESLAWQLPGSMRIVSATVPKWCNSDFIIICAEKIQLIYSSCQNDCSWSKVTGKLIFVQSVFSLYCFY